MTLQPVNVSKRLAELSTWLNGWDGDGAEAPSTRAIGGTP